MVGVKSTAVAALIRLNQRIHEIRFILQKLQLASTLVAGQQIEHTKHGRGVVVAVNFSNPSRKPYRVKFENGQSHNYSMTSASKLKIIGEADSSAAQGSLLRLSSFAQGVMEAVGSPALASEGSALVISGSVFRTPNTTCDRESPNREYPANQREHQSGSTDDRDLQLVHTVLAAEYIPRD
jgi:hypothetical protein